ncbi:MAG: hypothetical protein EOM21_13185 [Gammaproteobacteria bacterium]|nr:hypothetical protein [Gammaproteobacteria bacterium]
MASPTYVKPGLVISRRAGDVMVVELPKVLGSHRLTMAVTQIDRNRVKLGVNCLREWVISRDELLETYLAPEHAMHHTPANGLISA